MKAYVKMFQMHFPLKKLLAALLFVFLFVSHTLAAQPNNSQANYKCSYDSWNWNTLSKRSENRSRVIKSKAELSNEERGTIENCSVCEEDQGEIFIASLPSFKICKTYKERIETVIKKVISSGFPISSISGYRVGKSKGPINSLGQRTQFSNHSYGIAIDFNAEKNGLYDSCLVFGLGCKLIRGGIYNPTAEGSVHRNTLLYQLMIKEFFKWGGEINGKQKDFMHFSLDGT